MGRIEGKVAVLTGGASGLGRASAALLAKEGAKVVITDINTVDGQQLAVELNEEGYDALFLKHDVASEEEWEHVIEQTVKRFGGVDVLVNNAGVVIGKTVEDTTLEEWHWLNSVNLDGVFLGTQQAIKYMRHHGGGSIINLSSIAGIVGDSLGAAYSASKGGVKLLTKSAALLCAERKYKIRVNSIHPGYIFTNMVTGALATLEQEVASAFQQRILSAIPFGHMGEPMDVAYGVLYLASDESKYMTGSELVIDGGYTAQ